jgi:hypothetical protein
VPALAIAAFNYQYTQFSVTNGIGIHTDYMPILILLIQGDPSSVSGINTQIDIRHRNPLLKFTFLLVLAMATRERKQAKNSQHFPQGPSGNNTNISCEIFFFL